MNQFLSIVTVLSFAITTYAADPAAKEGMAMDPKMQEVMMKYQTAATPGEAHKVLKESAGKWKTENKMWQTADSKPEVTKGSATFKMVLDGRWMQQEFKGQMMGKPVQGIGMTGYDNVKQKYVSHWFDSMSTWAMTTEGTYDAANKTFNEHGSSSCPISADKTQDVRNEIQMISKNKMIFSMYGKDPVTNGPEFKMMEITYTK